METAAHILIVDDDSEIRTVLSRFLAKEGYRISTAANAEEMRQQIKQDVPQLIVLDLILPGEDGFTLAKEARATLDVGIIMVTGKQDTVDKIVGLEMGADDYITKPFDDRELLARVRSVLRRTSKSPTSNTPSLGSVAHFSGWKLDLTAHELYSPTGEEVRLTSYEYQLLTTLVKNANQVFSRDQIMNIIADRDWSPVDRSIDVLVSKLRTKLNEDPRNPSLIKTIRGAGYKFTARVEFD